MSTTRRRRTVVAGTGAAALLLSTALTGCGAGFNAATSQPYNPTNGTMAQVGDITLQNVIVIQPAVGAPLDVQAGIVNIGSDVDVLTAATVSDKAVTFANGVVPVPLRTNVAIGTDPNIATVTGVPQTAGQLVTVTFSFRDAGQVAVTTVVAKPLDIIAGS